MNQNYLIMKKIITLLLFFFAFTSFANAQRVRITSENFPDENFRRCVRCLYGGVDGVFTKKEIAHIRVIDCSNRNIEKLAGIHYFTNLKKLNCEHNKIEDLSLNFNPKLVSLNIKRNKIKSIDLSNCPNLEELLVDEGVNVVR